MGKLSTHVLDTTIGKPGQGIRLELFKISSQDQKTLVISATTNSDGRCDQPLLEGANFLAGEYQIEFDIGKYFEKRHQHTHELPFLNKVVIRFGVGSGDENYHVPLVVTPWSYSTYRGS
jgi:5-hydroxyisourate hydrolase